MSVRISALAIGIFGSRLLHFSTERPLIPKWIEIEPVVRRKPRVMLQAIDVALHPMLDVLRPPVAIQDYFLSQSLEVNFVVVAPAVKAEKQNDRAMHNGSK
jgi:hypothetical protein